MLASLGAAELGLRTLSPQQLGFVVDGQHLARNPEFQVDETRNAKGLHDAEWAPRTDRPRRLLLLGDSYVAAISVSVEQTVGQQLEAALDARAPGIWDVVSLGGRGWGTGLELEAASRLIDEIQPDLVLLLFLVDNDVRNNHPGLQAKGRDQIEHMQRYRPGWFRLRLDHPALLLPGSRLNQAALWMWAQHGPAPNIEGDALDLVPLDFHVYRTDAHPIWDQAWQQSAELLGAVQALAHSHGAGFALANATTWRTGVPPEAAIEQLHQAYPLTQSWHLDMDRPGAQLGQIAAAMGAPYLDLSEVFRAASSTGAQHWPADGHWNVAGNALAGATLAGWVHEELGAVGPPKAAATPAGAE